VRWARLDIRRGKIPSLDEVEEARTNVFFEKIRTTLEAKQFKPHDRMIDRLLDQGYASTDICSALIHLLQGGGEGSGGVAKEKKTFADVPAAQFGAPTPVRPQKPVKPAPAWAAKAIASKEAGEKPAVAPVTPGVQHPAPPVPPVAPSAAANAPLADDDGVRRKSKYERPARTGREPGKTTLFLNVGRKQLVTPADIVGKIAGVTRLPPDVVGAIDIHQRHTLVDVAEEAANVIVQKLAGIRVKGVVLEPAVTGAETAPE
jgi:ATP-dependent RNA helicase DeaD